MQRNLDHRCLVSAVTAAAGTTTVTQMVVISPKDYEEQCKQPVAITTGATMAVTGILHLVTMFALFTKLDKMFNPNRLASKIRQEQFLKKVSPRRK
jgi:hypothetical protein